MTLAGIGLAAKVQWPGGCSRLFCLLVFFSSLVTSPALVFEHPGLASQGATTPSLLGGKQEEICTNSALPAIKFVMVAGIGFVAGGALTIREPLASALLHGL